MPKFSCEISFEITNCLYAALGYERRRIEAFEAEHGQGYVKAYEVSKDEHTLKLVYQEGADDFVTNQFEAEIIGYRDGWMDLAKLALVGAQAAPVADPAENYTLLLLQRFALQTALEIAEADELKLREAIIKHRAQRSDDRCWMDDQELYAVLGDGDLGDNRVGDPEAMLANCKRFLAQRCAPGGWPTYAELEMEIAELRRRLFVLEG